MSNVRTNVGLTAINRANATGSLIGSANLARYLGFVEPTHATSAQVILGEIAQDVIATDSAGYDYPAGTWWVRTMMAETSGFSSNTDSGGTENTTYWIAVPSSLPGAFTRNDRRNNRPLCAINGISQPYSPSGAPTAPDFAPSYTPSGPIRTASGLYVPKGAYTDAFGTQYPYGPVNMGGLTAFYDFGSTGMNFPNTVSFPASAGYRNVRMRFSVSDASMSAYWGLAIGSSAVLTVTVFGTTYTVHVSDLTHNSYTTGLWTKTIDTGPSTHALGDFSSGVTFSRNLVNSGDPTNISSNFGWRSDFFVSPRIDIPLPWTVADGANVIAGGYIPSQLATP